MFRQINNLLPSCYLETFSLCLNALFNLKTINLTKHRGLMVRRLLKMSPIMMIFKFMDFRYLLYFFRIFHKIVLKKKNFWGGGEKKKIVLSQIICFFFLNFGNNLEFPMFFSFANLTFGLPKSVV